MKPLKYYTEVLFEITCIDRFIFRVSDIRELENMPDELQERLSNCHIYLICKRPRITLKTESIEVTTDYIYLTIDYRISGESNSAKIKIPRQFFKPHEVRFEVSEYPHREINTYDSEGNHIATTLLANLAHLFSPLPDEVKDLEVLYIGKGLKKSAKDRLENHATLQKILADVNSYEPDMEIFALVYSFDRAKKHGLQKNQQKPEIQGDEVAKEHYNKIFNFKPSLDLQVALIEASLISYFRTDRYNTHYIDFPQNLYKLFSEFYEMDFAALIINIDNENIGNQRIFSQTVSPNPNHQIITDFRKMEGKFSYLEKTD
jgi:hypothetical protein